MMTMISVIPIPVAIALVVLTLLAKEASAGCIDETPLPQGNLATPSPYTFPNIPDGSDEADGATCSFATATENSGEYDVNFQNEAEWNGITVNYAASYPNGQEADDFKLLCEELWACNKYQEQYIGTDSDMISMCLLSSPGDECSAGAPIYYLNNGAHETRRSFVVNQCYGAAERNFNSAVPVARPIDCDPLIEGSCLGYQESLTSLRNKVCNAAQDLAEREQFVPEDAALCTELVGCMLNFIRDVDQDYEADGDFSEEGLVPDLCRGNVSELQSRKDTYCNLLSPAIGSSNCDPYVIPQGNAPSCGVDGNPALPTCPDDPVIANLFNDYGPNYPNCDDPATCQGYLDAVASISNSALVPCQDDRTDSEVYTVFVEVKKEVQMALILLKNTMEGLPDYPNRLSFVAGALEAGVFALDSVLKQADYHDDLIDSAEIEAFYENTRQLLDGSASIYDEVVCRCVKEKRKGHGCDSIDNDCDQTVDECDEDGWAPEIDVGQAICQCGANGCGGGKEGPRWWTDSISASECVERTTISEDDCDPDSTVEFELVGTCFDALVQVNAEDRCNNTAVQKQVNLLIDEEDPIPSCSFGGPLGKNERTGPGPKIKSALLNDGTVLVVDDTGAGVQYDVQLQYGAVDNCGGDMDVKVDIFSNEIEDFQSQQMALLYQTANDEEERVGLFVATTSCSTAANGQCIQDPARTRENGKDFRLYTVVVTATDQSGRSGTEECQVIIAPNPWNLTEVPSEFLGNSTQRFHVASHTSTLANGTLPLPEPEEEIDFAEASVEARVEAVQQVVRPCEGQSKKWCRRNNDVCNWDSDGQVCSSIRPDVVPVQSDIDGYVVTRKPVSSSSGFAALEMPAMFVGLFAVVWQHLV